jgi:hypothetical protein
MSIWRRAVPLARTMLQRLVKLMDQRKMLLRCMAYTSNLDFSTGKAAVTSGHADSVQYDLGYGTSRSIDQR